MTALLAAAALAVGYALGRWRPWSRLVGWAEGQRRGTLGFWPAEVVLAVAFAGCPTIHLMQGASASGKSTYARKLIANAPRPIWYVALDPLRHMLHGTRRQAHWEPGYEAATQYGEAALVAALVRLGIDVLVDDTHCYPGQLEHLRKALRGVRVRWKIHRMDTPLEECLARDADRENGVGEACIRDLHRRQQEAEARGWRLTPEWMTQAQTQEAAA